MEKKDYQFIQDQIGYEFKNLDLLQQAFVRRSYSMENGGEDNEVLEFLGDKVLDIIVIKLLAVRYGFMQSECEDFNADEDFNEFACEKTEAELTEIKKQLVQKKTLAERIDILGLDDYLIMGRGDIQQNANEEYSVREDLFEAILGAIAVDSNWNMEAMQSAVEIMLAPESIFADDGEDNYVSLIQEWTLSEKNDIPWYHFEKGTYQITWYIPFDGISQSFGWGDRSASEVKFHCYLRLSENLPVFRGFGKSKAEARRNVCKLAYEYLEKHDLLPSIRNEIDNPNKNDSINQLEILARRGYFSIPKYDFKESHDENGNPVWKCKCHIKEYKEYFWTEASSKKEAKKTAAYLMLLYVLGEK